MNCVMWQSKAHTKELVITIWNQCWSVSAIIIDFKSTLKQRISLARHGLDLQRRWWTSMTKCFT